MAPVQDLIQYAGKGTFGGGEECRSAAVLQRVGRRRAGAIAGEEFKEEQRGDEQQHTDYKTIHSSIPEYS